MQRFIYIAGSNLVIHTIQDQMDSDEPNGDKKKDGEDGVI